VLWVVDVGMVMVVGLVVEFAIVLVRWLIWCLR